MTGNSTFKKSKDEKSKSNINVEIFHFSQDSHHNHPQLASNL